MSLLLALLLLLPSAAVAGKGAHSSFSLDFFPGDGAISQLALSGANATSTGAISMPSPHARVQYDKPIAFAGRAPGFSTYFSFSLRPDPKSPKAASLAFFLTPASSSSRGGPGAALAVVFAAEPARVRIDVAGDTAARAAAHGVGPFAAARKLYSWVDYNATSATLQVRLSASRLPKPPRALLSCPLDLSAFLRRKQPVLAGFASEAADCSLFSWAFRANNGAPYQMHSQPLDPSDLVVAPRPGRLYRAAHGQRRGSYHWLSLLFAAACGAMLTFFVLFVWYSMVARRPVAPVEYPMHPSDVVYEKIVLVGVKDAADGGDK